MKLLYSGAPACSWEALKRLLIVADELVFMDRPCTVFGDPPGSEWGEVGIQSPMRQVTGFFAGSPVAVSVHEPPTGLSATPLFQRYLDVDLEGDFRSVVLEGLGQDELFAAKLIQLDGKYPSGSGREIVSALVGDPTLRSVSLSNINQATMFQVGQPEGRRSTLRSIVTSASVAVTSAMLIARRTGTIPVSDDPFFARLVALRTERPYVGGAATHAPFLGLEMARAVIPDAALQQLEPQDILEYRRSAKDAYTAWSAEINALAAKIDDIPATNLDVSVARVVAELVPKLRQYENEMKSARDKLFGDLIKGVAKVQFPTLSLALVTGVSLGQAALAFATAVLFPSVPAVVDYFLRTGEVKRNHTQSYLIGLAKEAR
jgi:hypothetical protein